MINKVILVGRVGKDPEVKHLESGVAVANFPLATSEKFKDRNTGEKREETEWSNVVLWRGLAEVVEQYVTKGDLLYIEGKKKTRSWEDKDGNTRYTTDIVAEKMQMLGGNSNNSNSSSPSEPAIQDAEIVDQGSDVLPF